MADVRALRAIRYNLERHADRIADLVAPPYDVLSDAERDALYERHKRNIIRLDLTKPRDDDEPGRDRYARARRHLMDWIAEGDLVVEAEPAIYVHRQDFEGPDGERAERRGIFARVKLEPYEKKVVLPHEITMRGPKEDRLRLFEATECNLSPLFLLHADPERVVEDAIDRAIASGPAELDLTTPDGVRHELWRIEDAEAIEAIERHFKDEQLLIADGHHRYETALAYRDRRRAQADPDADDPAPYDFALALLVALDDPGLRVYPTHRGVYGLDDFDPSDLLKKLADSEHFEVEPLEEIAQDDEEALIARLERAGRDQPSFIVLADSIERPTLIRYVGGPHAPLFYDGAPDEVRVLDVAVLHQVILDRFVGISAERQANKEHLNFFKYTEHALEGARDGSNQMVVLMNATPVDQIDRACRSGGVMPQKSTYFYPKILSGLLINPL